MSYSEALLNLLRQNEINDFFGVPDSTLKHFTRLLEREKLLRVNANEGCSVAQAMGYYLATDKIPCVYLQNSGLGNIVNPLASLLHEEIYSIPIVILMGWRGGIDALGNQIADEPQHKKMGKITLPLLDLLDIPYELLPSEITAGAQGKITKLLEHARHTKKPVCLVAPKGILDGNSSEASKEEKTDTPSRYQAVDLIRSMLSEEDLVISTTGMASRELFASRENSSQSNEDFLTVGGMGLASQIAYGVSTGLKGHRRVVILDGDGAFLMHMGGSSEASSVKNIIHILLNNGVHDSVGGFPTSGQGVDYCSIAKTFGYDTVSKCDTLEDIRRSNFASQDVEKCSFVEIIVRPGNVDGIGRPEKTPKQTKELFMRKVNNA